MPGGRVYTQSSSPSPSTSARKPFVAYQLRGSSHFPVAAPSLPPVPPSGSRPALPLVALPLVPVPPLPAPPPLAELPPLPEPALLARRPEKPDSDASSSLGSSQPTASSQPRV